MKIQQTNVQPPQPELKGKVGESRDAGKAARAAYLQGGGSDRPEKAGGGAPDQVSLSALSQQVRVHEAGSEEREAKIEALAALVAAGKYQVDPLQLSQKIVADAEQPAI